MQIYGLEEIVVVLEKEIITGESYEKCEESVAEERKASRLNSPTWNGFVRVLQFARHVGTRHDTWEELGNENEETHQHQTHCRAIKFEGKTQNITALDIIEKDNITAQPNYS